MQQYQTLSEGNKHNRRAVADAVQLLTKYADFQADDRATISTPLFRLTSREPVAQVCVVFEDGAKSVTYLVWLPTSGSFKGRRRNQTSTEQFNIL